MPLSRVKANYFRGGRVLPLLHLMTNHRKCGGSRSLRSRIPMPNAAPDSHVAKGDWQPLIWRNHHLVLLDQTQLPGRITYLEPRDYRGVIKAIKRLSVRGAPLIGAAAAFGLASEAFRMRSAECGMRNASLRPKLLHVAGEIKAARPTAVNLAWAVERLEIILKGTRIPEPKLAERLEREALAIYQEEIARSRRMGRYGARLIRMGTRCGIVSPCRVLTICNAGRLAAPGQGTALAAIYVAHEQGKSVTVYVPETRPLLQGARLTAVELSQAGIPVVLLTDSMIATIMPEMDLILTGADRIAANGDTANKIGTYQMALLAHHFRKPFYPVAPVSTFDFNARTGRDIPIEQRAGEELLYCGNRQIAPKGIGFHNPAFDVTPARFITGIVTDQGILSPPFGPAIARLRRKKGERRREKGD